MTTLTGQDKIEAILNHIQSGGIVRLPIGMVYATDYEPILSGTTERNCFYTKDDLASIETYGDKSIIHFHISDSGDGYFIAVYTIDLEIIE